MKRTRILTMLLTVVLMMQLFAGCGDETLQSTVASAPEEQNVVSEVAEISEVEMDSAEDTAQWPVGVSLPLVAEMTTITAFRQFSEGGVIPSLNDNEALKELERRTNVHVEWTTYSSMDTEPFNLFIASQDYTDLIVTNISTYSGGIDKAIEDEVYLAGNDYLELMPNFCALRNSNTDVKKQTATDSGNVFFTAIQSSVQPPYLGPMVRGDWLEDLQLDTPVTYDDWYEMLTAFKNEKGAVAPVLISSTGYSTMAYGLTSGYDVIGDFYAENGTTVKYGFTQDGMKEYVEMIAKWYAEGLIDPDFISHNTFMDGETMYANNQTGAFEEHMYIMIDSISASNDDPDNYVVPVAYPSKTKDAQGSLHFGLRNEICGANAFFITTAAVERGVDDLCAQWIDYRYSEEGANLLNFGIEGTSYEFDENGQPQFTDYILNNDQYTSKEMMDIWTEMGYGNYYVWERENQLYDDRVLAAYDVWGNSTTCDWNMPPATMTAEEAEAYSALYSDISVYVNETVLQFITGTRSLDDWDTFVAAVESMGIDECIGYKQAALDRYNNR